MPGSICSMFSEVRQSGRQQVKITVLASLKQFKSHILQMHALVSRNLTVEIVVVSVSIKVGWLVVFSSAFNTN